MNNKYKIILLTIYIFIIIFTNVMASIVDKNNNEKATFGAGCFWCIEAIFEIIKGVDNVEAGYAGGDIEHPTYEEVCTGKTGHAEVVQITYNPNIINYENLLEVFWKAHDPTTLNRQGADIGSQYRSVIFYHSNQQKIIAEKSLKRIESLGVFSNSIVTEITNLGKYYPAENYHQDYFRLNNQAPYCQLVIKPKLDKLKLYEK